MNAIERFQGIELEKAKEVFDWMDVSENTRIDYKARIGLFVDFIKENGFNRNSFLSFKRYLESRTDIKTATKNKYLASARVFLRELARQGVIPDITLNIKSFKESRKHKRDGINEKEMKLIIRDLRGFPNTPKSTRLKAIIYLLAFQGLRLIELTRLDVSDIDLKSSTAMIHGKSRDDKEKIYLHPLTVDALKKYLEINQIKSGPLFQSKSNRNKNGRVTTRAIQHIVNGYLKELEIDKVVHAFRHFYCTAIVKGFNGDLAEAIKFTRHKNVETVMIYYDDINLENKLPDYYKAFDSVQV